MILSATPRFLKTPKGREVHPFVTIDSSIIVPWLIRMAKGLFANFYPDIQYNDLKYSVLQVDQFRLPETLEKEPWELQEERGKGVFRACHRRNAERSGQWLLVYYSAAAFTVDYAA
jgi:hypothetical protein